MFNFIRKLFGGSNSPDFSKLLEDGAQIVDVRRKEEYIAGNIQGSINIPLDALYAHLSQLDKIQPIITCCSSGMRSASARSLLKGCGFRNVYNGGGWRSLANKIAQSGEIGHKHGQKPS
ncbi:MAG TPA: rhodanese-like domain-containing protein [Flavipsychrobacter sp.]|nr:rhodanese-like domain-containing protein [Flavipsychrobacter sp.]